MDRERESYRELFETLALADTALDFSATSTLRASEDRASSFSVSLDSLPQLSLSEHALPGTQLQVGATIGEGGMGIVRAARQMPFGREVALKTMRADRADPRASELLIREAIVNGRLEHPNVVPVYAVGRDGDGLPVIVMKRIDGDSWREHLRDPEKIPSDDVLEWHLQVFQQVCNAVEFAHSLRVIHRDIKPENVMIGAFDEVYLVDWGLGASLERDDDGALPFIDDVPRTSGTPHYMAPEMTGEHEFQLGLHTDVYLLGAVLHEIVTGKPRHDGGGLFEVMFSAFRSEPVNYESSVPGELAAICNKATARDPAERYPSAHALRDAVRMYLRHRSAEDLARRAQEQLVELRKLVAGATSLNEDERRVGVYRLYGAARFGFEEALDDAPHSELARDGLQETLVALLEWELSHGSVHAAAALLAELGEQREDLHRRLRELQERLDAEARELAELRDLRRQRDLSVGSDHLSKSSFLLIIMGIVIPAILTASGLVDPITNKLHFWLIAVYLGGATILITALGWRGSRLFSIPHTDANRRLSVAVVILCLFLMIFRGVGMYSGFTIDLELTLELFCFALFTAALALAFDWRLMISALVYLVFGLACLLLPAHVLPFYLVACTGALVWMVAIWGSGTPEPDTSS